MSNILDAVREGRIEDVKRIIQTKAGAVNETNEEGETPLHIAVQNKDLKLVKYLLENGADVNAQDNIGATALYNVCYYSYEAGEDADTVYYDIAQYLLQKNASPNTSTYKAHATPIMIASAGVNSSLVELLIAYHANANDQNNKAKTAIHHAAASNKALHPASKLHIIEILIKAGCQILNDEDYQTIKNHLNNDDLHFAIKFDELIEKYHLDIIGKDTNEI